MFVVGCADENVGRAVEDDVRPLVDQQCVELNCSGVARWKCSRSWGCEGPRLKLMWLLDQQSEMDN